MRLGGTLFAVIWHAGVQPASLSKRSVIMTELLASRKQLSADALFRNIRRSFHDIPDPRTGKPDINLPDAMLSGLAVFAFKDPSLLAFDQRRQRDEENLRSMQDIYEAVLSTRKPPVKILWDS
jgi:hypothetical protein